MADLKNLQKELANLPDEWIALVETSANKIINVNTACMKYFIDKNYTGIVLSASRPCTNLLKLYEENKIDKSKILVLCCVCTGESKQENVIHIGSETALTSMALAISKAFQGVKGRKFLFIDSINTLLIHNEPNSLARFIHSVLTKMRQNNVSGLLISIEKDTNREVRSEIAQLCDKIIKV